MCTVAACHHGVAQRGELVFTLLAETYLGC